MVDTSSKEREGGKYRQCIKMLEIVKVKVYLASNGWFGGI